MSTRRPKQQAVPSLLNVMARASRAIKTSMQLALEPHGVHAGQNFILERLWEQDGQTPGEIAEAIGVEGPTVVRALQRMAAAGLVVRKKHPSDGRQIAIHLTPAGSRLRSHLPRLLRQVEQHALAAFSKAEQAQLLELLERISENLPG